MHVSPDRPMYGFGSTTNDNTARRFLFSNTAAEYKVTGLDRDTIKQFQEILFVLSIGHEVNIEHFDSYC